MNQSSKCLGAAFLAAAACAPQATDEYLGEPLLTMRGSVSTAALTTTQPIAPALCFYKQGDSIKQSIDVLPQYIQDAFAGSGLRYNTSTLHILDVQVHGQFPAEFNVDVYAPPPAETIAPLFIGEPAAAWGSVCAVQVEHQPVAQLLSGQTAGSCESPIPDGACLWTSFVMTQDASRYYYQQMDCPYWTAPADECEVTRGGDETILAETGGFEDVVATAQDAEVVYLAEPAPPGSYTAYRLGAPDGLSAGYHLILHASREALESRGPAMTEVIQRALAETNRLFGTSYTNLPAGSDDYGSWVAPSTIVDAHARISARLEMELLPLLPRTELAADDPGLTLDLAPKEMFERLPVPPGFVGL